jgi:ribosomal protein L11 methylase PrmA
LELGAFDGRRLVILSGLFDPDAQDIKSELLKRGLKLIDLKRDERWTTMMFEGR